MPLRSGIPLNGGGLGIAPESSSWVSLGLFQGLNGACSSSCPRNRVESLKATSDCLSVPVTSGARGGLPEAAS